MERPEEQPPGPLERPEEPPTLPCPLMLRPWSPPLQRPPMLRATAPLIGAAPAHVEPVALEHHVLHAREPDFLRLAVRHVHRFLDVDGPPMGGREENQALWEIALAGMCASAPQMAARFMVAVGTAILPRWRALLGTVPLDEAERGFRERVARFLRVIPIMEHELAQAGQPTMATRLSAAWETCVVERWRRAQGSGHAQG